MRQSEEAAEPCADLAKAKEACLAEVGCQSWIWNRTHTYLFLQGGDCAALVKSFVECMEAAKAWVYFPIYYVRLTAF